MLTILAAKQKLLNMYPYLNVKQCIPYSNLFVFTALDKRVSGTEMDPFYSVNKNTGEILNFSPYLYDEDKFFSSKIIDM